jgi:hypothetical protein
MRNGKKITMDVIGIIVDWALLDAGTITTLEIKNYLRSKGFDARQKEVSELLNAYKETFMANGCTYEIDDKEYIINVKDTSTNGVAHRLYYLEEVGGAIGDGVAVSTAPAGQYTSIADVIAAFPGVKSNAIAALCQSAGISATEYQVRGIKASLNR